MATIHDASGGYATRQITVLGLKHQLRVHLQPFSAVAPFTYTSPAGTDLNVTATLTNLDPSVAGCYNTNTTLGTWQITQQPTPDNFLIVGTVVTPTIQGTSSTLDSGKAKAVLFEYRDANGNKCKIELFSCGVAVLGPLGTAQPASIQAMLNAVLASNVTLMSKRGAVIRATIGISCNINRRLFKRLGY